MGTRSLDQQQVLDMAGIEVHPDDRELVSVNRFTQRWDNPGQWTELDLTLRDTVGARLFLDWLTVLGWQLELVMVAWPDGWFAVNATKQGKLIPLKSPAARLRMAERDLVAAEASEAQARQAYLRARLRSDAVRAAVDLAATDVATAGAR